METKSIFKSKTFWLNILGLASMYGDLLPPKYSVPVLAVANIANRFLTSQPVSVMGG
jgi:hypothetical protein